MEEPVKPADGQFYIYNPSPRLSSLFLSSSTSLASSLCIIFSLALRWGRSPLALAPVMSLSIDHYRTENISTPNPLNHKSKPESKTQLFWTSCLASFFSFIHFHVDRVSVWALAGWVHFSINAKYTPYFFLFYKKKKKIPNRPNRQRWTVGLLPHHKKCMRKADALGRSSHFFGFFCSVFWILIRGVEGQLSSFLPCPPIFSGKKKKKKKTNH